VPHDLHLHPERLVAHAVTAAELSEDLRAALRGAPPPHGATGEAEEQVHAAVRRAVQELAALAAALAGAAAASSATDRAVARALDGLQS
jgi:hypothetical protein